jgi:hypothetical protein
VFPIWRQHTLPDSGAAIRGHRAGRHGGPPAEKASAQDATLSQTFVVALKM